MSYSYTTRGTCSRKITFDLEDGIVKNVRFIGGCDGNTKGIAKLVDGMKADDVIENLREHSAVFAEHPVRISSRWLSRPLSRIVKRGCRIKVRHHYIRQTLFANVCRI